MRGPAPCGLALMLLWCCAAGATADSSAPNATRGVDDFMASLTHMIRTVFESDPRYSQLLGGGGGAVYYGDALQTVSGRPNRRPPPADYFDTGRPPFLVTRPPPYLENGPPYPQPDYQVPQGGRPIPYPYGPGRYPQQNSIVQALSSISQHDDLRCVPRLLCEVSSGARPSSGYYQQPGYYQQQQQQQQQSSIPFLSKDALVTLLTVLNFVDDSPLLMFGRAALLGYNNRGDPRSCTTAYPTCPRDPDQLINYLNNHNGGFFRFFNQQLPQYAPQYASHQQPPYPPAAYPPQSPPPHRPPPYQLPYYRPSPPYPQQQYAAQFLRPQQYFGHGAYKARADRGVGRQQSPRILTGSPEQYYDVPSVQDLALDVPSRRPTMTFPSDDSHGGATTHNAQAPFAFPSGQTDRRAKRIKMIFPDRTGTGGLRADLDQYGNYKGVYYAEGSIKFADEHRDDNKRPSKIVLPTSADEFDGVSSNRLPYDRRQKLQFPRTL